MKKLFIAALLFVGIASFAQDTDMGQNSSRETRERLTPEQRNEKQLKKITTELNLNTAQQEQVKLFIAEKSAKAAELRKARKGQKEKSTALTAEQKESYKKQMIAEKDANDAKMKEILTADQYAKWKTIQEENRKKARHQMKEYKRNNE
jgi:hypothetical protein